MNKEINILDFKILDDYVIDCVIFNIKKRFITLTPEEIHEKNRKMFKFKKRIEDNIIKKITSKVNDFVYHIQKESPSKK